MEDFLTTDQVAERLGVSVAAVQSWIRKGKLQAIKTTIRTGTGVIYLVPAEVLLTFQRPKMGRPRQATPATREGDQEPAELSE